MTFKRQVSNFTASDTEFVGKPMPLIPNKFIFYIVFFVVFCFSGLLTITGKIFGLPYRMGLISVLIIPLILKYGLRINKVILSYLVLTIIVILSGIINNSTILEVILFMRILGFSYLMYMLVDMFINPKNVQRIIQLCVLIALIQLPIILIQRVGYDFLPEVIKNSIRPTDFDFGTFNFKGDASMTFFLLLIVIFLLFDRKKNYIIRHKWIVAGWLTLTILIANAELVKLLIFVVWSVYLMRYINIKSIIAIVIVFSFIAIVLSVFGVLNEIKSDLTSSFLKNAQIDLSQEEKFLSGDYARGAAVAYYLKGEVLLLGDGPSRYYDVFTQTRLRGNTGHIFTFYSEVGLLGWMMSVLIFFLIAFPISNGKIRVHWTSILGFVSVVLLSFTTEIMNDISVVLIYCVMAKSYLVEPKV